MRNRPTQGVAVVAAALGVAVAVLGVTALRGDDPPSTTAGPAAEPTVLGEDLLLLDHGPVSEDDALAACSVRGFAAGEPVEVLYAVHQDAGDTDGPVVILRNATGELRLCDTFGSDSPAQAPVPTASDAEPVVALNARAAWDCSDDSLERYASTTWLAVADQVDSVRQRLVVDGEPGPWFTTRAAGGFVHLGAWQDGPLPAGTALATEYQVLDADGAPVAQDLLPGEPTDVGWCEDGDVQIG